jgi:DNA-binding CsgD family transcriptional regulator
MNIERFSALIDGFYSAALEPERWPEAAAETASFFDLESTAIQVRADGFSTITLRATTANYDLAAQQDYLAYFHKLDPFANALHAIGRRGIFFGHELVDPETFRTSEIYHDYCRRLGIFHSLGAGLSLGPATNLMLGIHRPIEREDFTGEHRRRLELVVPHLSRAVQMHMLLTAADLQRRLACDILAALSVAAIVVDEECRMVFANDAADQLLKAGDGLRIQQARLTTRDPEQEPALQQAICRASVVASGGIAPPADVLSVRRARKRPLSVLVTPFQRDAWTGGSAGASAIVFANDPESRRLPVATALARLYRFTSAEARLVEALLQGERIADYADRVGISINTANTQLKHVFTKTETNRQADLMRQMFSDPIASMVAGGRIAVQ